MKQLEAALNVNRLDWSHDAAAGSSFKREQVNRSSVGWGAMVVFGYLEAVKGYFASCHKLSNWEL
jgi:hypothetical protein